MHFISLLFGGYFSFSAFYFYTYFNTDEVVDEFVDINGYPIEVKNCEIEMVNCK